jgi:hypothetical protein
MSCSLWRWTEECETHFCPGDCDLCELNDEEELCIIQSGETRG